MNISVGFDHGAIALREAVLKSVTQAGYSVIDHGTKTPDSVDYPDYARLVADDITSGKSKLGILCCTTGIGMCIAANKVPGIRAANVHHVDEASLTRRHNNANVLCLGALHTTPDAAHQLIDAFLNSQFEGGRHERRVCKFTEWETDTGH